jgi:O-antigen/teichoic acid export membrane protein
MAGLAVGTAAAAALSVGLTGSVRYGLPGPRLLRDGLVLGLPLILHSLAVYMLLAVDRIVIASVLGLGATGRYQVAYQVGSVGVTLVTALNQAWIPLLLGADASRRWEILAVSSRAVHQLAAIVAGAVAVATPLGLLLAAPPEYDRTELVPVAAVVAFSILPYATLSTYFNVVFVAGRTRIMAVAAPAAAVLNLGLNVILLPVVGLIGASVATVAAYAVLAAIIVRAAGHIERLRGTLRTALLAWAGAAPVVAAGALLPPGPVGTGIRLSIGGVLLIALARLALDLRRAPTSRAPGGAAG